MSNHLKVKGSSEAHWAEVLAEQVPKLMTQIGRYLERTGPDASLSVPQVRILMMLDQLKSAVSMRELAWELGVTAGTLSVGVKKLVRSGHIKRLRSSSDERVVQVHLSALGGQFVEVEKRRIRDAFGAILKKLTPDQQVVFCRSHQAISDLLDELIRAEKQQKEGAKK